MVDISGVLLYFTSNAFVFLVGEIIEWSILVHDGAGWHLRFGNVEGHPNLRPLISTLKVAMILFAIILVLSPFVIPQFWSAYLAGVVGSSKYWILLFILSMTFSFLWIWHHVVGKAWNWGQYGLAGMSVCILVVYLYVNLI
jgi:hypothetical protein